MNYFYGLFVVMISLSSYGQELQRSSLGLGGNSSIIQGQGSNLFVAQTVGQASPIGTINTELVTVRQGYQQPTIQIVGLAQEEHHISAVLHPNPATVGVTISFNESLNTSFEIRIYDALGRQVFQTVHNPTPSLYIDLSNLSSGTYVLQAIHNGRMFQSKLIKN